MPDFSGLIYLVLLFGGVVSVLIVLRLHADDEILRWDKCEILTSNERSFYKNLNEAVDDDFLISFKVRLADLIEPGVSRGSNNWYSQFNKVKSKHVDFVLLDKISLETILVIELDDRSHNTFRVKQRDKFVNGALESANINVLRYKSRQLYDSNEIRNLIVSKLTGEKL